MLVELRQSTSCYYTSPRHQRTLWGQFVYIYEGRGILQINSQGLRLTRGSGTLDIPFKDVKSVGLKSFSRWVKPGGLSFLTVTYANDWDAASEIYLIPFASMFAPTWDTSLIVQSWYETLKDQDELRGKVEPPTLDPEPVSPFRALILGLVCLGMPVAVALFSFYLFRSIG